MNLWDTCVQFVDGFSTSVRGVDYDLMSTLPALARGCRLRTDRVKRSKWFSVYRLAWAATTVSNTPSRSGTQAVRRAPTGRFRSMVGIEDRGAIARDS